MSIEAMKKALEALLELADHPAYDEVINNLRAAIKAAEQKEPVAKVKP